MVCTMPNIWLHASKYTAKSSAFWITWMAPILLKDRLPDEHYKHLLLFSKIIKTVTALSITEKELVILEEDVKECHAKYER